MVLDDMSVLQNAVDRYRSAVGARLEWPTPVTPAGGAVSPAALALCERLFDVDRIPEQVSWLYSQASPWDRLFPALGRLLPWPTTSEVLYGLSLSVGTPFPWRHQIPIFDFDFITYTFVLAGSHQGEIWRYETPPDTLHAAVRAASSLASLFTQWADGITAGMVRYQEFEVIGMMLDRDRLGHPAEPSADRFRQCTPALDMRAFPASVTREPDLHDWQRECGVDMDAIARAEDVYEELEDEVDAARRSLGF